jgi:hypothetical protein
MSDQDLEVLITLDDPWYGPDEDTFHRQSESVSTTLPNVSLDSSLL